MQLHCLFQVLAGLIRSDCAGGYKWRALQVVVQFKCSGPQISKKDAEARKELLRDKQDVSISTCSKFVVPLSSVTEFVVFTICIIFYSYYF